MSANRFRYDYITGIMMESSHNGGILYNSQQKHGSGSGRGGDNFVPAQGHPNCELGYISGKTLPVFNRLLSLKFTYHCPKNVQQVNQEPLSKPEGGGANPYPIIIN